MKVSIEYDKQLYMLILIFDQVNAALMNIRDKIKTILLAPNIWMLSCEFWMCLKINK